MCLTVGQRKRWIRPSRPFEIRLLNLKATGEGIWIWRRDNMGAV
jgi:hypothetical protein